MNLNSYIVDGFYFKYVCLLLKLCFKVISITSRISHEVVLRVRFDFVFKGIRFGIASMNNTLSRHSRLMPI